MRLQQARCTTDGEVSITVGDDGNGFEHEAVPGPTYANNRPPDSRPRDLLEQDLMDEVDFEQGGSVVHMRKGSNARPEAGRKTA